MDGLTDEEIIAAVQQALEARKLRNFELVRLRKDYSVDEDKIKFRMEITFDH